MKRALTRKFRVPPVEGRTLTFSIASTVFSSMVGQSKELWSCDSVGDETHNFPAFDLLRDQLHSIFRMIPMFIQAWISLERVNDFLDDVSDSLCSCCSYQ